MRCPRDRTRSSYRGIKQAASGCYAAATRTGVRTGLADAFATLLDLPAAGADGYPQDQPSYTDRLTARFLRHACALPVAVERGKVDTLILAMADSLDIFMPAAVASATGLTVCLEIAVPIELDAALARLYPDPETLQTTDVTAVGDPLELDTERLKDLASEAPVIQLYN